MTTADAQRRFHETWLGLAQPFEGLVFSVAVLANAQIAPRLRADLGHELRQWVAEADPDAAHRSVVAGPHIPDLHALFAGFLGYDQPWMLIRRDELPDTLSFYAAEGQQEIRPSFAIARRPPAPTTNQGVKERDVFVGFGQTPAAADASPNDRAPDDASDEEPLALVWDLRDDFDSTEEDQVLSLDRAEDRTGTWRYPPTAKMERLLRHTGVEIGLLSNGHEVRLLYAPARETSAHLTFRLADMRDPAGRPLLAAFELLLGAARAYRAAPDHTLEGLLRQSRINQAEVTSDLAEQVFEAVEILLQGFESAWARESSQRTDWLRAAIEEPHDHLYQGVLSVVLRLVFLLYAEDKSLLPVGNPFYARHLSLQGLYDELIADAGRHPESMHHRFGAYGRLLALFRAIFFGVEAHEALGFSLPPRRGRLFDPNSYRFLEGGLPGSTAAVSSADARSRAQPPRIDDETIRQVLRRLIMFKGQRLSYRALDVEQIGSIYESLMGYRVLRTASPAVRLGGHRVWVESADLRCQPTRTRKKWLKTVVKLNPGQIARVEAAVRDTEVDDAEGVVNDKGLDTESVRDLRLAEALLTLAPGPKRHKRRRHFSPIGRLVLQPGEERRRSGSHYTPRSLTQPIVARTLEPLLACLGPEPTEAQILSLKICDPAMGSGAFLVETCRQLADALVAVWDRAERSATIAETHGDPHLHARRLVAQRCLYGVDKNAAAVELAKLSLWIVTLAADLPFTFVDHALRHGDALVGLDLEQITAFHWQPKQQLAFVSRTLSDALEQAIAHRQALAAMADQEDPISQEEKRRLLDHAEYATQRIRLAADVCVGAFFAEDKVKARETERQRRQDLVQRWLEGDNDPEPELRDLAEQIREQHAPFHWWLEFPEVFYEERPDPLAGGEITGATLMEGFVGNPPFLNAKDFRTALGASYLPWMKLIHPGSKGKFDLVAQFFRRAAKLTGRHGCLGLVSTNSISSGASRETSLKILLKEGWTIHDARKDRPWGRDAAVTVHYIHLARGLPNDFVRPVLDGEFVQSIDSFLEPRTEREDPRQLGSNNGYAAIGTYLLNDGFILTPNEKEELIQTDRRNSERIFPLIGFHEVATYPDQHAERYTIHFGGLELEQARHWPDLLARVRKRVKPEREQLDDTPSASSYKRSWWRFARFNQDCYSRLDTLDRCLVTGCAASKHLALAFQPTDRIFSHALCVFPLDSNAAFAILQSRAHEFWAWLQSSSMKSDLRYSSRKSFSTFPFPDPDPRTEIPALESIGERLYKTRADFMIRADQGLTKTYNALKDPDNEDDAIVELRRLHEEMDRAVLDAYGWSDVDVPPYCPRDDADRTRLQTFEDEVIDRLYVLNAERAAAEKKAAAQARVSARKTRSSKTRDQDDAQAMLFGGNEDG